MSTGKKNTPGFLGGRQQPQDHGDSDAGSDGILQYSEDSGSEFEPDSPEKAGADPDLAKPIASRKKAGTQRGADKVARKKHHSKLHLIPAPLHKILVEAGLQKNSLRDMSRPINTLLSFCTPKYIDLRILGWMDITLEELTASLFRELEDDDVPRPNSIGVAYRRAHDHFERPRYSPTNRPSRIARLPVADLTTQNWAPNNNQCISSTPCLPDYPALSLLNGVNPTMFPSGAGRGLLTHTLEHAMKNRKTDLHLSGLQQYVLQNQLDRDFPRKNLCQPDLADKKKVEKFCEDHPDVKCFERWAVRSSNEVGRVSRSLRQARNTGSPNAGSSQQEVDDVEQERQVPGDVEDDDGEDGNADLYE
ncbi:hypothetical protein P154DRAFT_531277 [Amniculicola lignicola CBS 123094]|uniref:Uncharacterized protein n=1 Tax=Amniculicola lignicola CBS 123094 TaxID=1392246 RepID=A0A6A5WVD9_9PLEO|nr:hypothetical protein P154DRAFT_531277 [Amniculicola lignicola CBS 123094]